MIPITTFGNNKTLNIITTSQAGNTFVSLFYEADYKALSMIKAVFQWVTCLYNYQHQSNDTEKPQFVVIPYFDFECLHFGPALSVICGLLHFKLICFRNHMKGPPGKFGENVHLLFFFFIWFLYMRWTQYERAIVWMSKYIWRALSLLSGPVSQLRGRFQSALPRTSFHPLLVAARYLGPHRCCAAYIRSTLCKRAFESA